MHERHLFCTGLALWLVSSSAVPADEAFRADWADLSADGRWPMADGRWPESGIRIANRKSQIANGVKSQIANRKSQMVLNRKSQIANRKSQIANRCPPVWEARPDWLGNPTANPRLTVEGKVADFAVAELAFTDTLPPGAEPPAQPELTMKEQGLDLNAGEWQAMFDWLGNPTDRQRVEATEAGLRFTVEPPGRGMKWRRAVSEGLDTAETPYLTLRYRARGLQSPADYFLYLGSEEGGAAKREERPLMPDDLEADGRWHVLTVPVPAMVVQEMALQVQAAAPEAFVEVAALRFTSQRPRLTLAEVLSFEPGWPAEPRVPHPQPLDLTPLCNADHRAALKPLGFDEAWFPQAEVTVEGVPFRVVPTPPNLMATPLKEVGRVTIPVGYPAWTLYLLLSAHFVGSEEPSIGSGDLKRVRHVERFVAQLDYADGVTDFIFPYRLGSYQHVITEEPAVYVLEPTRDAEITALTLHDGMRQGAFYLAAVTVEERKGGRGWGRGTGEKRPLRRPGEREGQAVRGGGTELVVQGQRVEGLVNRHTNTDWLAEPGELFRVTLGEEEVAGSQLAAGQGRYGPLQAELAIAGQEETVALRLTLTNTGDQPLRVKPTFPLLSGLSPGGGPSDLSYCFPRRGAVIHHIPMDVREPYSGLFPLQFMDVYHPEAGGVYLLTHDLEDTFKWFRLKKDQAVDLSVEYPERELKPGETWTLPETVIGAHAGDWHAALQAYRQWVRTWYRPAAPRQAWFREIFNFRQQFLHFALPRKSGMFDHETKTYRFREVMEQDRKDFGGVDYLHIFDWGWSEQYGRCGDYDHWEPLGGAEAFRQAVGEVQAMGIPVGLYIEGYLVDPPSNLGRAHGEEWQLLRADGTPYTNFAPSYHICSHVPAWQDYLAATYGRVSRETGVNGFYIDEFGFGAHYVCYNPAHGHEIPAYPLRGELALTRKVRESLPPETALYTEETPTDFNSQFQDGSFTYAISCVSDEWSPTHVNLTRFALPDFKTFEIITCDRPLGGDYQSVKRIFFNGEGIWLEGVADEWFTPETRAFIARMNRVQREHRAAFTSLDPVPLVPTLNADVYANEFPAAEETVWTLYNAAWHTVRGELLAVEHRAGTAYRDVWNDHPLQPRIVDGRAYLTLELGPKDVGCVVASRGQ